jgi:hypothetical protein
MHGVLTEIKAHGSNIADGVFLERSTIRKPSLYVIRAGFHVRPGASAAFDLYCTAA